MNTYSKSIFKAQSSYKSNSFDIEYKHTMSRLRRNKELHQHYFIMLVIGLVAFCAIFLMFGAVNISAHSNNVPVPEYKYYKSIVVQCDDTLSSIASENISTDHYDSMADYIKEVKQINNIMNDSYTISAGSNLIVPYYSTEYKQ